MMLKGRALTSARISAERVSSLPVVEEGATVRRKAMEIQYGNRAYLDAQTRLVEQQNERIVQQRKIAEGAATVAIPAVALDSTAKSVLFISFALAHRNLALRNDE
jgi:hypothetical protein